jgi:predicted amidohydrolase YtcJ
VQPRPRDGDEPKKSAMADRIILGDIVTLDQEIPRATALAVQDNRIIAVGSRDDVLSLRQPETRIDDYGDACVIPGFNDTHAHSDAQGLKTLRPSLEGATSIDEILKRVSGLVAQAKPGDWIVTMPVGEAPFYFDAPQTLSDRRLPTRNELDRVAPHNPVYLAAPGGFWGQPPCHGVLNSAGLQANGITRETIPASPHVKIHRDQNGEPNGQITETAYVNLAEQDILKATPRFTYAERLEGVRRAQALYHARGVTSVYEGHGCAPEVIACFRELRERNELTLRAGLVVSPTWTTAADAGLVMRDYLAYARGSGTGDDMLRISGVFIAYGGDPIIREVTHRDVTDIGWGGGVKQINTPDEFEALCELAARYDLRVHTVVSDKLHQIVPIFERIAARYPIGQRRWVLEHVSRSTQTDLQRVKALGVAVTLIPGPNIWKHGTWFMHLNDAELDFLSPAGPLNDLGVEVSAGSDAVPNDPLFVLWVMTTRRERTTGRIFGERGRVSNTVGLRLLTTAGAYLTFEEQVKGRLKAGYYADLAVLSADPLKAMGDDLLNIRCQATMVGGRWVYGEQSVRAA